MSTWLLLGFSLCAFVAHARFIDGPPQMDANREPLDLFLMDLEREENLEVDQFNGTGLRPFHQKWSQHPKRYNGKSSKSQHSNSKNSQRSRKGSQRNRGNSRSQYNSYQQKWFDSNCNIQCKRSDMKTPPLVILSFDGFANNYRRRNLTPSLEKMGECGATTQHMFPSYPSKTFPNHYTIATGLYPESHGIIDNYVYDPKVSPNVEDVRTFTKQGYFRGEPIWSTAVRQNKRMYCLHYPGCSYNITGHMPTVDIPFTTKLTYVERIDQITQWLKEPQQTRPNLIMAYFNQPDETGHHKKTDSEVDRELQYVDGIINKMLTRFKNENLLDCVNLVVVSDHGMQTLSKRFYFDQMMNTHGMLSSNGVVGRLYKGTSSYRTETTVNHLKCKNEQYFRVYDRRRMPARYHYSRAKRIGDVILEGRPGTTFYASKAQEYRMTSDHGYDYLEDNMKAIFFARGPNVRPRTKLPPFQNIELFNLFSDLLRLQKDTPNNGTDGFMDQVLQGTQVQTPISLKKQFGAVSECQTFSSTTNFQACSSDRSCSSSATYANQLANGCRNPVDLNGLFESADGLCQMKWCSSALAKSSSTQFGTTTLTYEFLQPSDVHVQKYQPFNGHKLCYLNDEKYQQGCANWTQTERAGRDNRLGWHSLLAGQQGGLYHTTESRFLLYENFVQRAFTTLQNWTRKWVKKFGKIGVLTAAVYDWNMDGLADEQDVFWQNQPRNEQRRPSHILRLHFYCSDQKWNADHSSCSNPSAFQAIAFALPNVPSESNCLGEQDFMMANTIRIRDFEHFTNLKFFTDQQKFGGAKKAVELRLKVTEKLWSF